MLEPLMDSPYRGLVPFNEADARFFRGRSKETRLVVANLTATRLTLLYGASGAGKTSLLRAGILSRFKSPQYSSTLAVYFDRWKGDPLINLQQAIVEAIQNERIIGPDGTDLGLTCLRRIESHRSSIDSLWKFVAVAAKLLKRHLVIILDQFDEYFLYHLEPGEDRFVSELAATLTRTRSRVSMLLSLQDDSLSELDRFKGEIPFLFDNYLRLEHLDREAARAAITEPLTEYRLPAGPDEQSPEVGIQPRLVEEVLNELDEVSAGENTPVSGMTTSRARTIKAPFLQLVMTRLWHEDVVRGQRRVLSHNTLKKLGGVKKIIQTHLFDVMRGLSWSQRRLATRLFPYLVSSSGGKRAETAEHLADLSNASPNKTTTLLERLEELRVLNSFEVRDTSGAIKTNYEIYHDYLAQPILDWRRAHRRKVRTISVLALVGLPAIILFWTWGAFDNSSDSLWLRTIVLIVLGLPLAIGFLLGRWWASAR